MSLRNRVVVPAGLELAKPGWGMQHIRGYDEKLSTLDKEGRLSWTLLGKFGQLLDSWAVQGVDWDIHDKTSPLGREIMGHLLSCTCLVSVRLSGMLHKNTTSATNTDS